MARAGADVEEFARQVEEVMGGQDCFGDDALSDMRWSRDPERGRSCAKYGVS